MQQIGIANRHQTSDDLASVDGATLTAKATPRETTKRPSISQGVLFVSVSMNGMYPDYSILCAVAQMLEPLVRLWLRSQRASPRRHAARARLRRSGMCSSA